MKIKEYFNERPLRDKIIAGVVVGAILFIVFFFSYQHYQETQANIAYNAEIRQKEIDAVNARKASEEYQKKMGELLDKWEREDIERRKANALQGINKSLNELKDGQGR